MISDQFETIWQQEIWPFLQKYADHRRQIQMLVVWGIIFIFSLSLIFVPIDPALHDYWWLSIIGLGVSLYSFRKLRSPVKGADFKREFKRKMFLSLNKLTDFHWEIDLGDEHTESEKNAAWKYMLYEQQHPFFGSRNVPKQEKSGPINYFMRHDGRKVFKDSGLYRDYTHVYCKDKLTSRWQHSDVVAYETNVEKLAGSSSKTIFRGFIIKASLDKEFRGQTYVQTELDSGSVAGENWLPFTESDVQETELEWIDFEKFLQVKSDNPTEAREIFTPDFMEVVHDWWQDHEEPLRIAFKNKAVYIAYPTKANLEPRILGKLKAEKGAVKDTLELLVFVENIIKTLTGGQRLWFDKPLAPKSPEDHE